MLWLLTLSGSTGQMGGIIIHYWSFQGQLLRIVCKYSVGEGFFKKGWGSFAQKWPVRCLWLENEQFGPSPCLQQRHMYLTQVGSTCQSYQVIPKPWEKTLLLRQWQPTICPSVPEGEFPESEARGGWCPSGCQSSETLGHRWSQLAMSSSLNLPRPI